MNSMIQLPLYRLAGAVALLTTALLISACGGGGGGKKPSVGTSSLVGNSSVNNPSSKNSVSSRSNSSLGGSNGSTGSSTSSASSLLDKTIVSREDEGGNDAPIVAIDAAGNAIAVWIVEDPSTSPTSYELLARRFVPDSGWQEIQVVAAKTNTHYIQTPALTIDKTTGKAMVIWETHDRASTTTSDTVARAYDPATGWGIAVAIDDTMPGLNSSPVADTDSNGNVMVVWNRYESLTRKLYAALYTSNGVWGSAIRIEDNNEIGGGGSGAKVAFLANGDALVVWNSSRPGTTNNIWGNKYTKGTGWGTNAIVEASINTNADLRFVDSPSIAADAKGNAVLTYSRQQFIPATSNYQLNVVAKRYMSGAWSSDVTAIGEPLTCTNCPRTPDSRVKVTAQGLAVAVWVLDNSAGVDTVWASRTRSDGTWESKTFSADADQFIDAQGWPDAGIDDAGNVSIVWSLTGSGETNIYSARCKAGTGWGSSELFESDKGTAQLARIAMNGGGNAMTVWSFFGSTLGTVVASKYYKP